MFPRDISPLIPALQSDWLHIHVTTAASGQAILAISFVAAIIYLVKCVDQSQSSKRTFWLEIIMFILVCTIGFVVVSLLLLLLWIIRKILNGLIKKMHQLKWNITIPAIIGPNEWELIRKDQLEPLD